MEIQKVKKGMILGKEEFALGRRRLVYGPVITIEEERVGLEIFDNGEKAVQTFPAEELLPIHAIVAKKNRAIGSLVREKRTLEGFVVALARGKVEETSVQDILELLSPVPPTPQTAQV